MNFHSYSCLKRVPAIAALLLPAAGCHSAYIETTVHNAGGQTISPIELDYPSASFGIPALAPNQDFHYRFKTQGSGDAKLIYTDSAHVEHTSAGPHLNEGDEGWLTVIITPSGVQWYKTPRGSQSALPKVKLGTPAAP